MSFFECRQNESSFLLNKIPLVTIFIFADGNAVLAAGKNRSSSGCRSGSPPINNIQPTFLPKASGTGTVG
ncbi:MAG: hypothetical protein LBO82_06010 [Synergistaceae bacterium]|nr:hypothetical protein [Synergistaceae bacterium]